MKRGAYRKASLLERLGRRTVLQGECWLWIGSKLMPFGYGQITSAGKTLLAHRVSYEQHVGPIPAGLNVLHHCDRPECWNPAHLFLGTHADNVADKVSKGRQYRGERHHNFTLTDEDLRAAIAMHADGQSWRSLSRLYRVSHDMVRADCARRLPSP